METHKAKKEEGFSLIELTITMVIMLALLAIVSSVMSRTLSVDNVKADAPTHLPPPRRR
jgi:prepilin-type N-terminal cleavage/methylation domain-containing protein